MRSNKTEIVNGQVLGNGTVVRGPFSCQRSSAGIYYMYAPPGKKIVSVMITVYNGPQWTLCQTDQQQDRTFRVVLANTGGSANVDSPFNYQVELAA